MEESVPDSSKAMNQTVQSFEGLILDEEVSLLEICRGAKHWGKWALLYLWMHGE